MPRLSTPDHLLGFGGLGSKVVYRFMQQRWILEEVVSNEYDDGGDSIEATVVDTTDRGLHDERYQVTRNVIDEVIEEADGVVHQDNNIRFSSPKLLPDILSSGRTSPAQLTSQPSVQATCETQNLNSWWLERGQEPLAAIENHGLKAGVMRRRSLAKALYHVAEHNGIRIRPNVIGVQDDVYIVVALGGGTGSGMVLDAAEELDAENVHLFAVLPHSNEPSQEKANAYAALSELEYAQLTEESPFRTITLIPRLNGGSVTDVDFEMVVVRAILAHQNGKRVGDLDASLSPSDVNGPPEYAPFTVATPYTRLYEVATKERASEAVEAFLDRKRRNLDIEADLYHAVEAYLREQFPDAVSERYERASNLSSDADATREEAHRLRERLETDIRGTLLEQPASDVARLDETTTRLKELIDESVDELMNSASADETNDLEFAERVPERVRTALEHEFEYNERDGQPYRLVEVLKQELDNSERRYRLATTVEGITSEELEVETDDARLLRTAVRDVILSPDAGHVRNGVPALDSRVEELTERIERLDAAHSDLMDLQETVHRDLEETITEWRTRAIEPAETLATLERHRDEIERAIAGLQEWIAEKVAQVEAASDERELKQLELDLDAPEATGGSRLSVEELNDLLAELGVTPIDRAAIKHEFQISKEARALQLDHHSGFLPGRPDNSDEFVHCCTQTGDYVRIQPDIHSPDIEQPFNCRLDAEQMDRIADVETVQTESIDAIVSELAAIGFGDLPPKYELKGQVVEVSLPVGFDASTLRSAVAEALERIDCEDAGTLLDRSLRLPAASHPDVTTSDTTANSRPSELLFDAYFRPILEEGDQLEGEREYAERTVERLEALCDELERPSRRFADEVEPTYEVDFAPNERDADSPYIVRRSLEPADLAGAPNHIGETSILTRHSDRIGREFENHVDRMAETVNGGLPITDLQPLGSGEVGGGVEYPHFRFRPVYLSRGFGDDSRDYEYDRVRDAIVGRAAVPHSEGYQATTVNGGRPDEVTMVLFVGGVFLDNLSLVTGRDGYEQAYERMRTRSEDSWPRSHHTIGLGGAWDLWPTLHSWTRGDESERDYGAAVFRETVREVDAELVDELLQAEGLEDIDAREVFLSLLGTERVESTVRLD